VSGNGNRGRCTRKVVKSKVWWFGFRTSPAIRALSWAKIAFRGYPGVTLWVSRLATWCGVTPQPNERRAKATRSKASALNLEWRKVPSTQYHSPSIGAVAKTRWSAKLLSTVFPKLGCHPGRVASEAKLLEYSRLAAPCQRPSAHRQQKSWGARATDPSPVNKTERKKEITRKKKGITRQKRAQRVLSPERGR
jgi:hypothetical protein